MLGFCIDQDLDQIKKKDQLKYVKKLLAVDFLTVKYHFYRIKRGTHIWLPPSSSSPTLKINGLFYADVLLLDRYKDKLTEDTRKSILKAQKELYALLPVPDKSLWSESMAAEAYKNAGQITHRDGRPV
jgi:hypothetical protein